MLTNYVSAMSDWEGRVDSETDYDSLRWHQIIEKLDLNDENMPYEADSQTSIGFAIIGFCSEQGVSRNKGRVGAALAPDFVRKQMSNLPCTFDKSVKLYDAGNILCQGISMEEGQELLGKAVEMILDLNLFSIVLGGGHETTFGHYQGQLAKAEKSGGRAGRGPVKGASSPEQGRLEQVASNQKMPDIGIVNFDAHFDLRPYDNGSSSGSMFMQIADICKKKNMKYGYLPLGIQKHSNTVKLFKTAEKLGVNYVLAREIQTGAFSPVLEKIDTFMYNHESIYLTICTDVFSAAFAPGVSATQAIGLDPEAVLPIIKHIVRTRRLIGFDICEISPRFDQDNTTASLGAVIIFSVVNTICSLKGLGVITNTDYFPEGSE